MSDNEIYDEICSETSFTVLCVRTGLFCGQVGLRAFQDTADALQLGVGHAGGESADQAAVAGVAVLVVPLDALGAVVLLGPGGAVLARWRSIGHGTGAAGADFGQAAVGEERDGEHLGAALGAGVVVEALGEGAGVDVAAALEGLDEAVDEPLAVLRQFLAHPQVDFLIADIVHSSRFLNS